MRSLLKGKIREESEPELSEDSDDSQEYEPAEVGFQDRLGIVPQGSGAGAGAGAPDYHSSTFVNSYSNVHGSGDFSAPLTFSGLHTNFASGSNSPPAGDIIDRGVISLDDAEQLVAFFIHDLSSFFPLVIIPPEISAAQLRHTKPVLFLSVISAASISVDTDLADVLNRAMVRLYAERFFIEGEKSLELVQALLLMTIFYSPPKSPLKLQFYQYTHIASTMALEIGLATKRRVSKKNSDRKNRHEAHDEHFAEQARAVLGCYHLGSM